MISSPCRCNNFEWVGLQVIVTLCLNLDFAQDIILACIYRLSSLSRLTFFFRVSDRELASSLSKSSLYRRCFSSRLLIVVRSSSISSSIWLSWFVPCSESLSVLCELSLYSSSTNDAAAVLVVLSLQKINVCIV